MIKSVPKKAFETEKLFRGTTQIAETIVSAPSESDNSFALTGHTRETLLLFRISGSEAIAH
jgi:hypothetical protein